MRAASVPKMYIQFISRPYRIVVIQRGMFIIICNITSGTYRFRQRSVHILSNGIRQHTYCLKPMLDFSETRDRVIPVSGKVNNPSSPAIPRNGCAPALSWTRIDIIIDTLMKVLIHFIFLHPLNIIKISSTSLALSSSPDII